MKELDYSDLGSKLRNARLNQNLTQEKLAEKCNISTSYLGHIERGTRKLSIETLVSLCSVLELSTDYVLMNDLPQTDTVILNILGNAKKKGAKSYERYLTIIKALSDIADIL